MAINVNPVDVNKMGQSTILKEPVENLQEGMVQPTEGLPVEAPAAPQGNATPGMDTVNAILGDLALDQEYTPEEQAMIEANRVPSMNERARGLGAEHMGMDALTNLERRQPARYSSATTEADGGGIFERANRAAMNYGKEGFEFGNVQGYKFEDGVEGAVENKLASALVALQAQSEPVRDPVTRQVLTKPEIDPSLLKIGSAMTEHFMADATAFTDPEIDYSEQQADEDAPVTQRDVDVHKGDKRLGQEISRAYQRARGIPETQDLKPEQAQVLGAAMKEMFYQNNPDLIQRNLVPTKAGGNKRKAVYSLTPLGVEAFEKTRTVRGQLFPQETIHPANAPSPKGKLLGEKKKYTKETSGEVGKRKGKGMRKLNEAKENLNQIANVVQPRRMSLIYATQLPILNKYHEGPLETMFASINMVGDAKYASLKAKETEKLANGEEYSAGKEMAAAKRELGKETLALAMYSDAANYYTYNDQGYNMRLAPQQRYNPTSSKLHRFAMSSATPVKVTVGSKTDQNLRQMYAMSLVDGADTALPKERERMLREASQDMYQMGSELRKVLDASMGKEKTAQLTEAIKNKVPLQSQEFPQFSGLQLDPNNPVHAKIIQKATKKGEDGLNYLEGLIDFADYMDALKAGRPHFTFFNAFMDGKTNGQAIIGMLVGSETVARRTGVIRNNTTQLLDDGDIRDALQDFLTTEVIDKQGLTLEGKMKANSQLVYEVARAVFGQRNLHKHTTMTLGYGKDVMSFVKSIEDYIRLTQAEAGPNSPVVKALAALEQQGVTPSDMAKVFIGPYVQGLMNVLSPEGIEMGYLMKGTALISALADELFTIEGPLGNTLHYGGLLEGGSTDINYTTYVDGKRVSRSTPVYESKATAAAPKVVMKDGQREEHLGRKAIGGALPGMIQSVDAGIVIETVTGKRWKDVTDKAKARGAQPYVHTIYDAFKVDAASYDTVLEHTNGAFVELTKGWDVFEVLNESIVNVSKKARELADKGPIDLDSMPLLKEMLTSETVVDANGNTFESFTKLNSMIKQLGFNQEMTKEIRNRIFSDLKSVGFNPYKNNDTMTGIQYLTFINSINKATGLRRRIHDMSTKTQENKARLFSKIKDVLQYYAH